MATLDRHAPAERRNRRRWQPSRGSSECFHAYVARNGAWRDHRRAPSHTTLDRFQITRTTFHRAVRKC